MAARNIIVQLKSGHSFPLFGLGTWQSKPNEVRAAVRAAIQAGYRHIDGAAAYGNEAEVGSGINDEIAAGTIKRQDLFVTTKLAPLDNRASDVRKACETSLKELGLEYVDLYLMHWPFTYQTGHGPFPLTPEGMILADNEVDYLDSWKEMEKLVDDGLVRSIGVCNFNEAQVKRLLALPPRQPVCNVQVELTPYLRSDGLVELCKANGIILTAYSPLGSPARPAKQDDDPSLFVDPVVCEIAKAKGVTPAQILIRFQLDRGIAVIPKSVTPSRIKENAGVLDFQLTSEELDRLLALNRNFRFIAFNRAKSCKYYPFA